MSMSSPAHRARRRAAALAAAAALVLSGLGACSSSDDASGSEPSDAPAEETTTTTAAAAETLQILVSNDDSYAAPGIDALVEGLQTLEGVEVTVVAPLEQQSGSGGRTTDGPVEASDVETASGFPATAVDGYPADSVTYAFEELDVEPDLVVSGINSMQNLGPAVDDSGTVGAARAGVAQGVPALAASMGRIETGDATDYSAAVPLVLEWITERRDALLAGDAEVEVTSLNVPSCTTGEVRGLVEVEPELDGEMGAALELADCTSEIPEDELTDDVTAFNNGFATISTIPAEPATS